MLYRASRTHRNHSDYYDVTFIPPPPYGLPRCCLISSVEPQGCGESALGQDVRMRVPLKLNNTEGTR